MAGLFGWFQSGRPAFIIVDDKGNDFFKQL
ncbi:hypothetical protein SAMN05444280_13341 [Tangfeifania diversioriginum]|uniref:Uncharacterized protein n=1 Tax=Tangfeifania diversioriginum TaxID=1168035 RepID=A0A1M6MJR0_9BACT|nr:hypothetical protein SAMN05444280_13341 [Tangfeifania diversioriginum]